MLEPAAAVSDVCGLAPSGAPRGDLLLSRPPGSMLAPAAAFRTFELRHAGQPAVHMAPRPPPLLHFPPASAAVHRAVNSDVI